MKLIASLMFVVFLLFGYESFLYAKEANGLQSNLLNQIAVQKNTIKTALQNQSFTFLNETDLDLEEEFCNPNGKQEFEIPTLVLTRYSFFNLNFFSRSKWNNIDIRKIPFRFVLQKKKNETYPLYIAQRVLRI